MAGSTKKSARSRKKTTGRDRTVSAGDRSAMISGEIRNSTIFTEDYNRVDSAYKFSTIFQQIEGKRDLPQVEKSDLKSELKTFEDEDKKGPEANEGFLAQRLRNIRRIAPNILEAATAIILNPATGFGTIAKKVAEKIKAEANAG